MGCLKRTLLSDNDGNSEIMKKSTEFILSYINAPDILLLKQTE